MTQAAEKKDVQKLQRVIVDALEDVKAINVAVFNTEHLSSLFERVILASGTSNRQTKALAASVRDQVRHHGFAKPRIEGEENGEWIIVDCGAAVAHIMQPNIRQYYNLEEIWGEKPVRLKFGAAKPIVAQPPAAKSARKANKSTQSAKAASKKAPKPSAQEDKPTVKKSDKALGSQSKTPLKTKSKVISKSSTSSKASVQSTSSSRALGKGAKSTQTQRQSSAPKA